MFERPAQRGNCQTCDANLLAFQNVRAEREAALSDLRQEKLVGAGAIHVAGRWKVIAGCLATALVVLVVICAVNAR